MGKIVFYFLIAAVVGSSQFADDVIVQIKYVLAGLTNGCRKETVK